jgi:hypothetical protein
MRNWLVPAALLGLSGVGLFFASERGREQVRTLLDGLARNGDPLGEFNDFLDDQVATIQRTLDAVAEALEQQRA